MSKKEDFTPVTSPLLQHNPFYLEQERSGTWEEKHSVTPFLSNFPMASENSCFASWKWTK
jgi:hypothetical protein